MFTDFTGWIVLIAAVLKQSQPEREVTLTDRHISVKRCSLMEIEPKVEEPRQNSAEPEAQPLHGPHVLPGGLRLMACEQKCCGEVALLLRAATSLTKVDETRRFPALCCCHSDQGRVLTVCARAADGRPLRVLAHIISSYVCVHVKAGALRSSSAHGTGSLWETSPLHLLFGL